ncbi:hypothetical protein JB92DRAFT_3140547 [Gautieria morchelliformis]|nr:hypothetical protein JB92DRAFT_3140547 [Gautieria morchelliformis]
MFIFLVTSSRRKLAVQATTSFSTTSTPYLSMQTHTHCTLFFILLVFPFIVGKFELAIASPLHAPESTSSSKFNREVSNNSHANHRHRHNHAAFTRPKSALRLAKVVTSETQQACKPLTTEPVTDIIGKHTKPMSSATSSDTGTSQAHIAINTPYLPMHWSTFAASTTSPISGNICAVLSKGSSTPAANSDLSSLPTASPQITEGRFIELPTATLVGVAIAGSVAANLSILMLWSLLGHKCLRKPTGAVAAGEELGPVDDTEKERQDSRNCVIAKGNPGLLVSQGVSPVHFNAHTPPSTRHQPPLMPSSSFRSAASSQWTPEHVRSNDHEAHQEEIEKPRRFTTFSLDTPVDPHLTLSPALTQPPGTMIDSEINMYDCNLGLKDGQDARTLTVPPPPVDHSRGDCSTDPRSPRRPPISRAVFIENYASPSIARYLPPHTQSTIITSKEGAYGLEPRGVLQERGSSRSVVEHELGPGSVAASTASPALPPSVSSEVMTPRRHWTFTDIHGPAAQPVSPQGFEGMPDSFPGTESSRTLAGDPQGARTGHFQVGLSSPQAPFSEPSSTDSFLHTDFGISIGSGIPKCRSAATSDTPRSFDRSIRTH